MDRLNITGQLLPLGISTLALIVAILSYCEARRSTYYAYLRKVEELSVVPVEFSSSYDDGGWRHRIRVTFVNNGDTELILTNFNLWISFPSGEEQMRTARGQPWEMETIVMRPHTVEIVRHEGAQKWEHRALSDISPEQCQFEFSYFVQTGKGVVRRRSIPISAERLGDERSFALTEPQPPFVERFDPKFKAPSPVKDMIIRGSP